MQLDTKELIFPLALSNEKDLAITLSQGVESVWSPIGKQFVFGVTSQWPVTRYIKFELPFDPSIDQ